MKKKFLFMMAMLTGVGTVMADNVTVENLTVPIGGQASLTVNYQFDVAEQYSGWQFSLELPEGLATVKDAKGNPSFTTGSCYDTSYTFTSSTDGVTDDFVALSLQSSPMTGNTGVLISIPIVSADNLTVGSTFNAKLKGIQLGNVDGVHTTFIDDVIFTISIGEPADTRIILDETSTSVPEPASDVDVCVKRTINANEWSTICLPFDMTEAQVYEAFGNDVQLAEYIEHEMNNDATALTVTFDDAHLSEDGLMANNPYIIKTSKDITEFNVEGVTIDPDEESALAEFTNGRTGSRKVVYGTFKGTYHAQTVIPENCLFLSGNQFWYSKGLTKMKAFRAYLDLVDVLASVEGAGSRISMTFNHSTGISDNKRETIDNNRYYDLQGRRVSESVIQNSELKKGLYIVNGKKIIK